MIYRFPSVLCGLLFAVGTVASGHGPDAEYLRIGPPTDGAALQGTWRVIDARARMSNEPAMNIDGLVDRATIEFSANTVTMRQLPHADLASFSYTLDTLASPHRLKMIDTMAPDSGKWTGIYRISGDTLRLSLPIEHFSNRPVPPTDFNAPNTAAYIFKRDPRNP